MLWFNPRPESDEGTNRKPSLSSATLQCRGHAGGRLVDSNRVIERDLRKLSAEVQAEIKSIAGRLGAESGAALYPVFERFELAGREYQAYFVPETHPDGRVEFVFACLFY